jgi:hypothetical protein
MIGCRSPRHMSVQSRSTFRENSPFACWPSFCVCFGLFDSGLWASGRRCGEPSLAAAAGRIQEEARTACANAIGSVVPGRSVRVWGSLA